MTQAKDILTSAARVLQDPEFVRWTKPEMLVWLSEAQIAVARVPGTYTKTEVVRLKTGDRQKLPPRAWQLVSVSHNVDEDGTPLGVVRLTTRSLLDSYEPDSRHDLRRVSAIAIITLSPTACP